jgi:hypothetical protein
MNLGFPHKTAGGELQLDAPPVEEEIKRLAVVPTNMARAQRLGARTPVREPLARRRVRPPSSTAGCRRRWRPRTHVPHQPRRRPNAAGAGGG